MTFVVPGEPAEAADPCERPLDDPSLRQDDEAVAVAAAHDLQLPRPGPGNGGFHFWTLVSGIADDALDEWEGPSCLPQEGLRPVAILHAGWVHNHTEQEPHRVGQNVALAADHLLAGIVAGRVERSPPLRAPFAVWLSMMAVVGLASRPAASRTST